MTALAGVDRGMDSGRGLERVTARLVKQAARRCGADHGSLFALRGGTLVPVAFTTDRRTTAYSAARVLAPFRLDAVPILVEAVAEGRPVRSRDEGLDPRLPIGWAEVFGKGPLVVVPLIHRDRVAGFLVLDNVNSGQPFTEEDTRLASTIAPGLTRAVVARRRRRLARAQVSAARALLAAARRRGEGTAARETLTALVRRAASLVHADSVVLYATRDGHDSLELAAMYSHADESRGQPGDGCRTLDGGTPEVPRPESACWSSPWTEPAKGRVLIPLRVGAELIGLLVCAWRQRVDRPSPRALAGLERTGARAALVIAATKLERACEDTAARRQRERVGAILHDTASQTLFSLGLKLELCLRAAERQPGLRGLLEAVKKDAGMTMTQLRALIGPPPTRTVSADAASERLGTIIQEFRDLTGLPVLLIENAASLEIGSDQLDALTMVIQSGLANVAQDSKVHRAEIRLDRTADELTFEVTGHGRDVPSPVANPLAESFAAAMMLDRVSTVGGRVEFLPCSSTTLRLRGALPLTRTGHVQDPHCAR
jgi:signal transduction histidine kinase